MAATEASRAHAVCGCLNQIIVPKIRQAADIRINDQWRICFRWQEGDAYDVEVTDYH